MFQFFFENRAVWEKMWENIAERDRPQMTIWRVRIACRVSRARNTLRVCYIYCFFFKAIMIARTRLNVTLCVHCLSCLFFKFLLADKEIERHGQNNPCLWNFSFRWMARMSAFTRVGCVIETSFYSFTMNNQENRYENNSTKSSGSCRYFCAMLVI
jgi:hypothetical protein